MNIERIVEFFFTVYDSVWMIENTQQNTQQFVFFFAI